MPRRYSMAKRADVKADTRARIVAAAAGIYRDRGLSAASNLAIARAADVAPATVRNHFPDPQSLADAVLETALAELQPPSRTIFDGVTGIGARVMRLAEDLHRFYARSEGWWQVYQRDPALTAAWAEGAERYVRDETAVIRAALEPTLADDDTAVAVLATLIGPPVFYALQGRGVSDTDAVALGLELVIPWLERREARAIAAARATERPSASDD